MTKTEELPAGVEVIRVGEAQKNVGIVAADLQVLPDRERRLGLYFQLASSFENVRTVDVIVRRSQVGGIEKLIEATVEPGLNEAEVYTLEDAGPGPWVIELDIEDALRVDNHA